MIWNEFIDKIEDVKLYIIYKHKVKKIIKNSSDDNETHEKIIKLCGIKEFVLPDVMQQYKYDICMYIWNKLSR